MLWNVDFKKKKTALPMKQLSEFQYHKELLQANLRWLRQPE